MRPLWFTAAWSAAGSLLATFLVESFLREPLPIIGTFLLLQRSTNAGIAFGIDLPNSLQFLLIPVAFVLVLLMAIRTVHTCGRAVGFGLILGGASANIVDRVIDGRVTDFIQMGTFPSFNVADSCITAGVALLLLAHLRSCYTSSSL